MTGSLIPGSPAWDSVRQHHYIVEKSLKGEAGAHGWHRMPEGVGFG